MQSFWQQLGGFTSQEDTWMVRSGGRAVMPFWVFRRSPRTPPTSGVIPEGGTLPKVGTSCIGCMGCICICIGCEGGGCKGGGMRPARRTMTFTSPTADLSSDAP